MSSPDRRHFLSAIPLTALAATTVRGGEASKLAKPKYRLGLVTYNVAATWDLPTLLKVCKSVGISPVELRTTHKHGVEPELSKEKRKEIKKQFADAGVEIWGAGTTCEFHSPNAATVKKQIETCKQFVELVADLGGKGVKVRPNDLPKGVEPAKTLEQIGKALIECGQAAANANVEIWVEVHGRETAKPAHVKTFMEHCGHPKVGLTWNSNPTDIKDGSVKEAFGMLAQWIRSCHINDLWKDQTGAYPYRELFSLLKGINYDRATLIEVGKVWKDPDGGMEFLRYYKALWNEQTRG